MDMNLIIFWLWAPACLFIAAVAMYNADRIEGFLFRRGKAKRAAKPAVEAPDRQVMAEGSNLELILGKLSAIEAEVRDMRREIGDLRPIVQAISDKTEGIDRHRR